MDIADQCDLQNEILHRFEVANSHKPEGPKANGKCHYCGEPVGEGVRWCDADCKNDWERFK